MTAKDPNLVRSGYSGPVSKDGVTVELCIYRLDPLIAGKFAKFSAKMSSNVARTMGVIGRQRKALNTWRARIAYRASVMINDQSLVVRKGDETAAGKVTKIEPGAVMLSGATEQRLEMFR